jgi:hypothetical protein
LRASVLSFFNSERAIQYFYKSKKAVKILNKARLSDYAIVTVGVEIGLSVSDNVSIRQPLVSIIYQAA